MSDPNGNGRDDAAQTLPPAAVAASLLADLVDVLLPGGGDWPSGATIGVQAPVIARLIEEQGEEGLARAVRAIMAAGGPFQGGDEAARIAIAQKLEHAAPEIFGWLRDAAFYAYYESPFVVAVINAQGHPYRLRPHVKGYGLPRFDPVADTPRHGRGHYIPTDQVRPVDISGLDLDSNATQAWGLAR